MIDSENIFSLFEDNEDKENFEGDVSYFSQSQLLFCLGMFTKLIGNIKGFSFNTDIALKKLKLTKDIEKEIKNKSENYVYEKALFFLFQIDLKEQYHRECISIGINQNTLKALQICLEYFESQEKYEKCANLKDFENFFHLSLVGKNS